MQLLKPPDVQQLQPKQHVEASLRNDPLDDRKNVVLQLLDCPASCPRECPPVTKTHSLWQELAANVHDVVALNVKVDTLAFVLGRSAPGKKHHELELVQSFRITCPQKLGLGATVVVRLVAPF